MNKRELVGAVAAHTDSDAKSAQKIVDGTIDVILATVAKGEVVNLSGFAKFERKSRPARLARNPQTGATVKVPAKKVAKITALKGFKDVALGAVKPPKLAADPGHEGPGQEGRRPARKAAGRRRRRRPRPRRRRPEGPGQEGRGGQARPAPARRADAARPRAGVEQPLHHGHVEPPVELPADLALHADQLEAAGGVERPRRRAAGLDPGHDGVEAAGGGHVDHVAEQRPAHALAVVRPGRRRPSPRPWCGTPPAPCRATGRRSRSRRRSSTATTAAKAPERAASHARWSSRLRGTRSKVAVEVSTSTL